jgi:O-acetyl-ADP-ribose deacetylase (regulator of RNase III)/uncharacterized protein YwgA
MQILIGDILSSNAQTLINTVNCVGVMGKGIALEFQKKYPDMYKDYVERCERKEVKLGIPYIYKSLIPPQIINFPTKDHWKSVSEVADIESGLQYLVAHYKEWGITSLAVPPLGCGNGQLEWKTVGPLIYRYLKELGIPVDLYAPYGASPKELTIPFLENGSNTGSRQKDKQVYTEIKPGWVALVEILYQLEQHPYHWPVGRTIFQKIAYIATREGLPTGLQHERGSFGPYAKDLKVIESRLINNNLLKEERSNNMFMVKSGTSYTEVRKKYTDFFNEWAKTIEKTIDLFSRMNTNQSEIVATVIFAAEELKHSKGSISESDVLKAVMDWKQKRRPPLNNKDVALTIRNLGMLHWLSATPDPTLLGVEEEAAIA